jgi:hypothetical protein
MNHEQVLDLITARETAATVQWSTRSLAGGRLGSSALVYRPVVRFGSSLRLVGRRRVGHGWVVEVWAWLAACGVEDHVGGGLGGVVGDLG